MYRRGGKEGHLALFFHRFLEFWCFSLSSFSCAPRLTFLLFCAFLLVGLTAPFRPPAYCGNSRPHPPSHFECPVNTARQGARSPGLADTVSTLSTPSSTIDYTP